MLFSLYPYAVWLSSRSLAYWWATLRALFGWQIYARWVCPRAPGPPARLHPEPWTQIPGTEIVNTKIL